jgi:Flp pilus assembly protein TadG
MMRKMSGQVRSFLRAVDGAAAIEFAIIVPIFIMFCFGIIETGRMMWIRNSIQTASEEAARFAMAHASATDAELVAKAADYFDNVSIDTPTFGVVRDTTNDVDFVTVEGTYTFQFMFTFFDVGAIELNGKARVPLAPS